MRIVLSLAVIGALAGPATADTSFGANSIIVPVTAPYQTDCGAVSAYGFVYDVLRANTWLIANGYGAIDVYYAYKDNKASPNRCTPTNIHTPPTTATSWDDGCDFSVDSSSVVPVKVIKNTTASTTSTDLSAFSTNNTNDTAHTGTSGTATYPNWVAKTVQHTTSSTTNVTSVRYWGGSFVINDADAVTVRKLIDGTLSVKDSANNTIDFSPFRGSGTTPAPTSGCTYGTTLGGQLNLHVAQIAFTAPTPKIFSSAPPRIALLARNGNQSPLDGSSAFTTMGTQSKTGRIADTILQSYLARAGLSFTGAQGCPASGYLATNYPSLCPSPNKVGQIYDLFDFQDIINDKLTATSGGSAVYKMLWMPHWELAGSSPNSNESTAISKIAAFADTQAGVMAECASIEALEGTPSGYGAPRVASASGQFQTCSSGSCSSTTYGLSKNSGGSLASDPGTTSTNGVLRNCSDPNMTDGSDCAYFGYPGDPYSQVGEYRWHASAYTLSGSPASVVADFKPNSGAAYRTGVRPLISGVSSLVRSKLTDPTTARAMINGDYTTRNYKDNNTAKSNILYLGNHDQTSSVAGTKMVLQTLLQLGDPVVAPTNREVSRAAPIIATVGTQSLLIQGSYENITPAPTTKTATNDTEAPSFEFPFYVGHMRAIKLSSLTTTEVDFAALASSAVAFDGATNIPPVTASGCSSNFAGNCRSVFTHTTSGQRPTQRFIQTSGTDYAAIKDLIAPTLTSANQTTVVSRILAGSPSGSTYVSRLGGIDHSTAAVIGPSLIAGSATRPQMIYVGATDGMLHAFCAKAVSGTGCAVDGRELWAFIPRTLLPRLRKNTARIDGSPRVVDLFGDFDPTDGVTHRGFKTVLLVHTASGDPATSGEQPSVTALDVTDPFNPTILWEYATPSTRGTTDFGQGQLITTGTVRIGATNRQLAFVETNNGGTGTSGAVVTAIDIETGLRVWQQGYQYPAPRLTASGTVPAAGIPGGAIGVDRTGSGNTTDVVYGTLYGDIFRLDATDGSNKHGTNPMFRFTVDKKPFGAPMTIFSDSGSLFAAGVSGGYYDPFALTQWADSPQYVVGMAIATASGSVPLTENSTLKLKDTLTGEKGFSQAVVVGSQLFVTTDNGDINSSTFGSSGDTGHLHRMDLSNGGNETSVVIAGGGGSIAASGTTLYAASSGKAQQIGAAATSATAASTNLLKQAKLSRRLWLRGF